MDKRPLTLQQQRIHDCFCAGMTVKEIHRALKMSEEWINHERYEIIRKGYDLPKLEIPRQELPADIELTKEIMRAMNEKYNRKKMTDEERQQIIEYRKEHTVNQTVEKFRRTAQTIANVCKAAKQAGNPAPEVPESEPTTPKIVVNAVRAKLEEVEKCISLSEQILASAREDRDVLRIWLEVHDAE